MIKVRHNGDFSKTIQYFNRVRKAIDISDFDKFGKAGVEALSAATPYDSGNTASSWYYVIENSNGRITISFHNSNIQNGCPIAVILQYGHGTRNGGWVEGRDYINPAIQPIFNFIVKEAWEEVTRI